MIMRVSLSDIALLEIIFRAHDWKVEWATETIASKEKAKKHLEPSPKIPQKTEKKK